MAVGLMEPKNKDPYPGPKLRSQTVLVIYHYCL